MVFKVLFEKIIINMNKDIQVYSWFKYEENDLFVEYYGYVQKEEK